MGSLARFWQQRRGFWCDVAPAVCYLCVLFWAGLIPLKKLPGPDFAMVDKVWHLLAFAGLAGLLARAFGHWGRSGRQAARAGALASGGLGALLEILQSFTAFRSADWVDLAADALGALLAYFVLQALARSAAAATEAS